MKLTLLLLALLGFQAVAMDKVMLDLSLEPAGDERRGFVDEAANGSRRDGATGHP